MALFTAQEEDELFGLGLGVLFMRQQRITGLACKGIEVAYRAGVGRLNSQYVAAAHVGQRFFCPQDGQRAFQTPRIQIFLEFHTLARQPLLNPAAHRGQCCR